MAFNLAEGYVQISERGVTSTIGRVSALQAGIQRLQSSGSRHISALTNSIAQMPSSFAMAASSLAGNLGASVFTSLASAASGASSRIFQMAAATEQSSIAFTTMLGSASQASSIMAEIRKYSGVSPLSVNAVTEGVTLLVNYGRAAGDAMDEVKMLGDIALGNEEKMKRLSLAYGQVAAKGRIMGGEVMQMVEAGFNPLTVIAEMTGDSMVNLQKKMEAGELPFELLRQAVQKVTGEGGKFNGMTARMGQSFSGVMGQLQDATDQTLGAIGTSLIDTFNLKGAALGLMAWIEPLQTQVPAALSAVKPYIDGIGSGLAGMVAQGSVLNTVFYGSIDLLSAIHETGTSAFNGVSNSVGQLGQYVSSFFPGMSMEVNGFFEGMYSQASFMVRDWDLAFQMAAQHVILFGANGITAVQTFFTNAVRLVTWFGGNFTDIMQTGADFVVTVFSNLATNIQSIWSAVWEAIRTGSTESLSNINFTPLTEGFKSSVKELPDFVSSEFLKSTAELDRLTQEARLRQTNRTLATIQAAAESAKPSAAATAAEALARSVSGSTTAAAASSQKQMTPIGFADLSKTVQAAVKANNAEKIAQESLKQLQAQTQQSKQHTELLTKLTQGGGTAKVVGVFG